MSLTSYRAAPPRVKRKERGICYCDLGFSVRSANAFGRPGGDLLSHTLRCSTIGAEGLNVRVRDGIACVTLAMTTKPSKRTRAFRLFPIGFLKLYVKSLDLPLRMSNQTDRAISTG